MSNHTKILKREESGMDDFLLGKRVCLGSHYAPFAPPQKPAPNTTYVAKPASSPTSWPMKWLEHGGWEVMKNGAPGSGSEPLSYPVCSPHPTPIYLAGSLEKAFHILELSLNMLVLIWMCLNWTYAENLHTYFDPYWLRWRFMGSNRRASVVKGKKLFVGNTEELIPITVLKRYVSGYSCEINTQSTFSSLLPSIPRGTQNAFPLTTGHHRATDPWGLVSKPPRGWLVSFNSAEVILF